MKGLEAPEAQEVREGLDPLEPLAHTWYVILRRIFTFRESSRVLNSEGNAVPLFDRKIFSRRGVTCAGKSFFVLALGEIRA